MDRAMNKDLEVYVVNKNETHLPLNYDFRQPL